MSAEDTNTATVELKPAEETHVVVEEQQAVHSAPPAAPEEQPKDAAVAAGPQEPPCGYPGMLSAQKDKFTPNAKLLYSAPISQKIVLGHVLQTQINCFSFAVCHSKELAKASYVHLYEDRLEWNYASSICLHVVDNPQVLYLDRDVAEFQTIPDLCRPGFTHCNCCPTACDVAGETVMLHGQSSCCWVKGTKATSIALPHEMCMPQLCIGRPLPICNRHWVMLPYLEDAQTLKFKIRAQREKLVAAGLAQQLTLASEAPATEQQTR